jgi:hypothetical protein
VCACFLHELMSVFPLFRKYAGPIEGVLLRILTADGVMTVAEAMSVSSSLQLSPGQALSPPPERRRTVPQRPFARIHTCIHTFIPAYRVSERERENVLFFWCVCLFVCL